MANLGFVRRCIDRRYGAGTREAFEQATGLGSTEYWDEAIAGGPRLINLPRALTMQLTTALPFLDGRRIWITAVASQV